MERDKVFAKLESWFFTAASKGKRHFPHQSFPMGIWSVCAVRSWVVRSSDCFFPYLNVGNGIGACISDYTNG